ncbi:zinc knuckle CX2CX4HX4C containing protein, partial [Tanacetum coccineum]
MSEQLSRKVAQKINKMTGKVDASTFGPAGHVGDENGSSMGGDTHVRVSDNTNPKDREYPSIVSVHDNDSRYASNATTNMHKSPNVEEVSEFNDSEILIHNIDDVANFFGVSLKSFKEIDDFTKEFETFARDTQTVDDNHGMVSSSVHELRVNGAGNDYANSIANINNEFSSKMETLAGYGTTLPDMVSPSDPVVRSGDINTKPKSYAGAAGASAKDQPTVSNFWPLVAHPVFDGDNISVSRTVVEKVSIRFEYTLYNYFNGKRMAFSVVEYYVRNNWAKHGLTRIMMNNKCFFSFKFNSRAGLEAVLEGGHWLIRKSPIILKNWSMDTRLLKEELTRISIWVKLHDVPIQVFKEDDISLIATFIGKHIMLDSYTSSMCNDSWGRS